MTKEEEKEMHDLAVKLEKLTRPTGGWEAMRYVSIYKIMRLLATYCNPAD